MKNVEYFFYVWLSFQSSGFVSRNMPFAGHLLDLFISNGSLRFLNRPAFNQRDANNFFSIFTTKWQLYYYLQLQ